MTKTTNKEEEYALLELSLEEEDQFIDSIAACSCELCGNRMTVEEKEKFETICEDCAWATTSGLIDDDEEKEIDL